MANLLSEPGDPHELVICGICAEPYDDDCHQAKFLTCHHTFCSNCLSQLTNREYVNSTVIECPNCRSKTRIPPNGVDALQTNFYIVSFQEISENSDFTRPIAYHRACHGHEMQPESYFCLTCVIAVCCECVAEVHRAKDGHYIIGISKTETTYLQELNISHKSLTANKTKLELIASEITLLKAAKETAMKDLETFMKLAQRQLEQRKNDLSDQILHHFNVQQNALLEKQNQIQEAIHLINTSNAQAKTVTKSGVLSKLKPICESLKEVNEKTQAIFSNMDLGANNFTFDTNKGCDVFIECVSSLGEIHCEGFLPTKMRFKNLEAKAGFKSVLTVEVHNHHGDKMPISSDLFSVQVTDPAETEIHTELCISGPDCTTTFTPQMSGLHRISGNFLGQKFTSEPTHISVSSNNPVLKFGEKGNGCGTFSNPYDITIDNDGVLYVADRDNRLIQKFSANGDFLSQFSVNDHNENCSTVDMALDLNNGLIYCTDIILERYRHSAGNNMLVFNFDGELQHLHKLSDIPFSHSIAMNSQGHIFISDITNKCIFKVDKEGNKLCRMGSFGYPSYITIADDDSVMASDVSRNCIYIFNPDGTLRLKFGSSGTGPGQLKQPWGVATDGENILVADSRNKRIQVFKIDGTFVSIIASDDDPLQDPAGLAVTKDGYVYVADCEKNCIQKYKYRDIAE